MSAYLSVTADALPDLELFMSRLPDRTTQAARMALNDVAGGRGLKLLREAVEAEVDFPKGYVDKEKLGQREKATNTSLKTTISGRVRATSLARFATPGQTPESTRKKGPDGKPGGTRVQIHHGQTRRMDSAFLIRLRSGAGISDENYNLGLAIRLKAGDTIHNKRIQDGVQLDHNLYLLYGPSVQQVFGEVASEQSPEISQMVAADFLRHFNRLED